MENSLITMCCITILIPVFFFILAKFKTRTDHPNNLPKSYPILGHLLAILENKDRYTQWAAEIVTSTPNLTFHLDRPFLHKTIITANPANVRHILKSHFHNYEKGAFFKNNLSDLLGDGFFNADGESWKFQRKISSHEFNNKSLRNFVERVMDTEISDRLIPTLESADAQETVIDFQDILKRLSYDSICRLAFGHDPEYLSPSLPREELWTALEEAVAISAWRFETIIPYSWKIKKALNVGSEKQLKVAVGRIRQLAKEIIGRKKNQPVNSSSDGGDDILSRILASGNSDEEFVADIIINFIIAGKDSTSAVLTWFFWVISNHPNVESEILREIKELKSTSAYEQVKDMDYTHASLCESMRLYPAVPEDSKAAINDDVLPDGTVVKKGMRVTYHPYAMGRVEEVWGKDWADFRPERWLEMEKGKWKFVNRDQYTYPVFQAGPRICLGREMAFIQMKSVVAGVLPLFRLVPALEKGAEPVYIAVLAAKMKGGFPVRVEKRG